MKNLILIRHAKSSWQTLLKDVDRPLLTRGILDAHLVSSSIADKIPRTFLIWTSIAKRASDTALIFAQNIDFPIESIIYKPDLYTFEELELEKAIKSCNNLYENIIVFCHNDAITDFVNKFGDHFIPKVPTSGFVLLQFETDYWDKITKGKTQRVLFPKDLK